MRGPLHEGMALAIARAIESEHTIKVAHTVRSDPIRSDPPRFTMSGDRFYGF